MLGFTFRHNNRSNCESCSMISPSSTGENYIVNALEDQGHYDVRKQSGPSQFTRAQPGTFLTDMEQDQPNPESPHSPLERNVHQLVRISNRSRSSSPLAVREQEMLEKSFTLRPLVFHST